MRASIVTDPSWITAFAEPWGSPAPRPARPSSDLVEFNEELRARFALAGDGRRIFGWQVRKAVAAHFGLTRAEIAGMGRSAHYVRPRQVAMYLCVRFAGLSATQAGVLFGGRDHTTVRHAVRSVTARIAADPALVEEIDALAAACRAVTDAD